MNLFQLKIFLLAFFFLIFLKIILFKVECNKPFNKENTISLQKQISSSFIKSVHLHSNSLIALLNCSIKNNTILIFEPAYYHQECTPGYTKYF